MKTTLQEPGADASLLHAARTVRQKAWCPYSGFQVGCAILDEFGRIHVGANVENASYGLTVCAERAAFFNAVAQGARKIKRMVIVTDATQPTPPCGACRQVLAEFGLEFQVGLAGMEGDVTVWHSMADLLPHAFTFDPARQ
ncbi:MAG: cytidine deaminase [Gemmataceae bacterium]